MRRHAGSQTQRTRRALGQEAMKRSHRRCDLIRFAPEEEPAKSAPPSVDESEQTDERAPISPHP